MARMCYGGEALLRAHIAVQCVMVFGHNDCETLIPVSDVFIPLNLGSSAVYDICLPFIIIAGVVLSD